MQNNLTRMLEEDSEEKEKRSGGVILLDQEAVDKMYSYMELNYGRSYLSEKEQEQKNRRLCRGAHSDCSLYYTDGIPERAGKGQRPVRAGCLDEGNEPPLLPSAPPNYQTEH